jgi:hypothetical protein
MMGRKRAVSAVCCWLLLAMMGTAQTRVSDRDLESMMRNLRDDAKSFQPVFNDSVKRSIIRKTSEEKDARNLVATFVKQTDAMLNTFKKRKKADAEVNSVLASAGRINDVILRAQLNPQTISRWDKVRSETRQIATAYGVQDPFSPGR